MDLYQSACELSVLLESGRVAYIRTEPEVPDFTSSVPFKILIFGVGGCVEFEVDRENLVRVIGQLAITVFSKDAVDRLYAWNFKSLCSYFRFFNPNFIVPSNLLVDIKVIENFLGVQKKRPENLAEALDRTRPLSKQKGWQSIYKTIHLPLMLRVLPSIESCALLNEAKRRSEHPYYEIEGQANGRMNCLKKFNKSYTPHTMGPEVRAALKPRGYGMRFVYSDFRHCEVTVLQWLSGDEELGSILESGEDLHSRIYEILTGDTCNTDIKRKISKKIFLHVMYGLGPTGLAGDIGVDVEVAKKLIVRIRQKFPRAWKWMHERQEKAKLGVITDYFGRPRQFDPTKSYLARNSSVQGVAATVCQEKLINLHSSLDGEHAYLAFSVHDGFGAVCQTKAAKETFQIIKSVCEAESSLCPGLSMKVEVKFGSKLDNMKVLWK